MGRITVLDNPLDLNDCRGYDYCGPFIDFLVDKYPQGFHGPHTVSFNLKKLKVEDYDRVVGPDDVVTLAVLPALGAEIAALIGLQGTWATVAAAVINAVTFAAISYGISAIFGPKASRPGSPSNPNSSGANSSEAGSPTYTLNTPTNTIRLGAPIPVGYGKNLIVPDIASQPYSWNEHNEQFVGMLVCLGQGDYNIHAMYAAGSPLSTLSPGVVTASVFPPSSHGGQFGVIQGVTGVHENVYTSPEVSDQELDAPTGRVYDYIPAEQWTGTSDGVSAAWFLLKQPQVDAASAIAAGIAVWAIIKDGPNRGTHRLDFIYHQGNVGPGADAGRYVKGHLGEGTQWNQDGQAGMALVYDLQATDAGDHVEGKYVGPYTAVPVDVQTDVLFVDLAFPNGAQITDSMTGKTEPIKVAVEFKVESIDNDGNFTGAALTALFEEEMSTRTRQRRTTTIPVPMGRYRVSARRVTAPSDRAQDASQVYWTGLKAKLGNTFGGMVYGNTTIIAVKTQASNGLASDALNRFSVLCTRKLNGVETRNPIDAFTDILTSQIYGGRLSSARLDLATISALRTAWAGYCFDGVFDSPTTVWDAAGFALQMRHAFPTLVGAKISIVEDKNYTVPRMSLTTDTCKNLSLGFLTSDGEEPDGVEGAYRDPDDNAELFAVYPPYASDPETVQLYGCRTYAEALAYVRQRWLQLCLRRRLVTLEAELEGHVVVVGTPVHITHPLLGDEPVLCIVNSVTVKDEFTCTIELHIHEPGVFA